MEFRGDLSEWVQVSQKQNKKEAPWSRAVVEGVWRENCGRVGLQKPLPARRLHLASLEATF